MKRRWIYFRGVKKFVALAIVFLLLQEVLALVFPMLLKNVADLVYKTGTVANDIVMGGILVLGVVVLIFAINFCSELFMSIAIGSFQKKMREDMYEKIQNAPTEKINEMGSGQILPLFMNDTAWVRNMQKQLLIFYVYFPITILGSIIMLFVLEPIYALFALGAMPIVLVFFIINSRNVGKIMKKSIPAFDVMHDDVKEGIIGAKEVRVFGKAKQREKDFAKNAWLNRVQSTKTQQATNLSTSFNALLFTIITVVIIVYGAYTMTDVSGIIVINTCMQYAKKLFDGAHYTFTLFVDFIPRVKIANDRISKVYGLPIDTTNDGKFSKPEGAAGSHFQFVSVGFKHPNKMTALTSINMTIEPGTMVAVTGGIGSGRTIIPQLILQSLKPSNGQILIGGTDISEINPTYYRRNVVCLCHQEPDFIPGTIRDNLKLLNPSVTDEAIHKCFEELGEQDFVKKFGKNFLDYPVGERNTFNASTKKLLNLVRSLLKDAPIYLFNQCFEHITNECIGQVMQKMHREKKTCLFVTQNNAVSKHCDNIYVLKNGRIVAEGKHEELLRGNTVYAELCSAAAGRIISEAVV